MNFDTIAVRGGYTPDKDFHSVTPPLYMTNAYQFESAEQAKKRFSLEEGGNIYTRLTNPTNTLLEERLALLEGGNGCVVTSSGHSAIFMAMFNLASTGDEIISSCNIYGGAVSMLGNTLKRMGITTKFIDPDNFEELESAITPKTKAIFTETLGNPSSNISDIEKFAEIAKKNGIPLMIDNTFATPYLFRPFEYGADIVVHSTTKFLGGHAAAMGGAVITSKTFNLKDNPRFDEYNSPDPNYHGMNYAETLGELAYITRLRANLLRDVGACASPFNSYTILQGVETIFLRMERHCYNAQKVAEFLEQHKNVKKVNYPGLKSNKYNDLAQKYLKKGCGSVLSFEFNGTRKDGERIIDNVNLFMNAANLGDTRSLISHPASTTHSQLSTEQLLNAGISEGTIRLSVGIEDIYDIIQDLQNVL